MQNVNWSKLAGGAALGWAANVAYYSPSLSDVPSIMIAKAKSNPIFLAFPLAGAYVGMEMLRQVYPSFGKVAWAAIGANLSVMFLAPMLDKKN